MIDNKNIDNFIDLITEFNGFEGNLNSENVNRFEELKNKILAVLPENQKIRFSQLEFYSEIPENESNYQDDLPF